MSKFKIIECTPQTITVNREPRNQCEVNLMRDATVDAILREALLDNNRIMFNKEGVKNECNNSRRSKQKQK